MDNFNSQYEKELAYQEITSNKYTLYGILLFIGVELLILLLNIIGFFELDNRILSAVIGTSIVLLLVFAGIPRSIILFVFTFMMQYIVTSSQHDAARIAQLTYLKETDSLTKLFNKNKYNEMVSMYYPNVDNITVIFWDLNNLKNINDTYGHEFGDKAISSLASVLYAHSDERRRIYRFGGDEFVMIIDNPHDSEADRIISAVKDELVKCSSDISIDISSAVGVASGKGSDIIEIVKNADSAMYADKQLCHHR